MFTYRFAIGILNSNININFHYLTCVFRASWNRNFVFKRMERRAARVSEAQWSILLEFLERNPNLARGYNNTARGRADSARLWQEVANVLNAEGSGTTKTPKDWSTYVSNYKSKLKKIVADINTDVSATGGGPPQGSNLSQIENRFLAIMGPGFGQAAPQVSVHPFPEANLQQQPSTSSMSQTLTTEVILEEIIHDTQDSPSLIQVDTAASPQPVAVSPIPPADASVPPLPRRSRQSRYRSRPLAPLDEARRILSQVEMQRAAADAAQARALNLIAQNLGRLADAVERFISHNATQ